MSFFACQAQKKNNKKYLGHPNRFIYIISHRNISRVDRRTEPDQIRKKKIVSSREQMAQQVIFPRKDTVHRDEIISEVALLFKCKVEKILKGSLDWISSPSPSVKIQIMGGKVCLRCKGKTLLGVIISLLASPNNGLPYYLK